VSAAVPDDPPSEVRAAEAELMSRDHQLTARLPSQAPNMEAAVLDDAVEPASLPEDHPVPEDCVVSTGLS
jgi:hypothetical protein